MDYLMLISDWGCLVIITKGSSSVLANILVTNYTWFNWNAVIPYVLP